jgi:prepilin-type N-terminal cleavage/methylation domain-containing protein
MRHNRPVIGGRTGGFSLVELLIVIAACGVLMGVSIPLFVTYHPRASR